MFVFDRITDKVAQKSFPKYAFHVLNPEYYYSILTINTVTILLHDVIHYSQDTAHNIWKFS